MTLRLGRIAVDRWSDLDGYAVGHNMPPLDDLPLSRFVNFIWWWTTKDAQDSAAVEKFKAQLWRPLPKSTVPIPAESPWSAESERSAFAALKQSLGSARSGT